MRLLRSRLARSSLSRWKGFGGWSGEDGGLACWLLRIVGMGIERGGVRDWAVGGLDGGLICYRKASCVDLRVEGKGGRL